jgi:hypothetical protein
MCRRGHALYADMKHLEAELARERLLERQPCTGQEALFGEEDIAALTVTRGHRMDGA